MKKTKTIKPPKVIVFDVNETMLSIEFMKPEFKQKFGSAKVLHEWFQQLLQLAFASSLTKDYHDFASLGRAALIMIAERRKVKLTKAYIDKCIGKFRSMPAHPDVLKALPRFKAAGIKMVSLTNSTRKFARDQLTSAGAAKYISRMMSVESVKYYKPHPAPYNYATKQLKVRKKDIWLVAAHDWDTTGALCAGWGAVLVKRRGVVENPSAPKPTLCVKNFVELANILGCPKVK